MRRSFLIYWVCIVTMALSLSMTSAQAATVGNDVPVNSPGNSANQGWVLEGARGEVYIGTEYGLSKMEPDGRMYAYTSHLTYGLTGCGEYLIYCRDDGLYAFDVTPASQPYPTAWLYEGRIGMPLIMNGYLYFDSVTDLYRIDVRYPAGLDTDDDRFKPELLVKGVDPLENDFVFAFNGSWAASNDSIIYQESRDGYRRESYWVPYFSDRYFEAADMFLNDTDMQGLFIEDGWLYFIPHVSYAAETPWPDPEPGVYRMKIGTRPSLAVETESGFPGECLVEGQVRGFNIMNDTLVCTGDLGEGPGLYTVSLSNGEKVKLYEGDTFAPNTTTEYIWFRTKLQTDKNEVGAPRYSYWRIRHDGSEPTQLDALLK